MVRGRWASVIFVMIFMGCVEPGGRGRVEKPRAPVEVELGAVAVGGGEVELRLVATPTRAVEAVELEVGGRREVFGATAAGVRRTMTARGRVPGTGGVDVVGEATVRYAGREAMRAAVVRLGAAAAGPAAAGRVVTLPGGDRVAEVRP